VFPEHLQCKDKRGNEKKHVCKGAKGPKKDGRTCSGIGKGATCKDEAAVKREGKDDLALCKSRAKRHERTSWKENRYVRKKSGYSERSYWMTSGKEALKAN